MSVSSRIHIGGLTVPTVPLDPAQFVGDGWRLLAEEQDTRSAVLTEVDFADVEFATCLQAGETSITGEEKLRRLKASSRIRYGASVFHGLWLDYQAHRENSVLEKLFQMKDVTYLDFFGDVLWRPDGSRCVLYLCRDDGGWRWRVGWLNSGWFSDDISTVSRVASS